MAARRYRIVFAVFKNISKRIVRIDFEGGFGRFGAGRVYDHIKRCCTAQLLID